MCTRFYVEPDTEEIREIIAEVQRSQLAQKFIKAGNAILTSGEIRPTNVVPVIAPNRKGRTTAYPMKWGFQIPGRSLLVNARTETAREKATFKESWEKRRCVIPASWYYEWEHLIGNSGQKKTGEKYMIQPKNSTMTWLCGLYRIEDELPVFTVLTRDPTEESHLCKADPQIKSLFKALKNKIVSLAGVVVEPKKLYIAFKAPKNIVDIEVQKHTLKLFINMRKGTLVDPQGITDDVSNIGHWGNGDYRVYLKDETYMNYIFDLILQSYNENSKVQE